MYVPRHMKWWGWGDEDVSFNSQAHPGLWPFAKQVLNIESDATLDPPIKLEAVQLREAFRNERFLNDVRSRLRADQICDSRYERVVHAYGKGFRDLFRMRRGDAGGSPDLVIYPENEEEVLLALRAAAEHDVVVIPFGGGSNIAGCLERGDAERMTVSLDMRRLRRVLEVDTESFLARIEAGAFGPDLEQQLNARGMTLGHFPDSFLHSTLGGWIATRSAGMQSDKYGKIEDMVVSLRMATPGGMLASRMVPKSSNGIDVNHLCVGSEGTLGVITEAAMRVHPRAELHSTHGYLFREFEGGIQAIHECMRQECVPSMVRLNDPDKTALSMAFRPHSKGLAHAVSTAFKSYLRWRGYDFTRACLMLTTFEGTKENSLRQMRRVNAIYRRFGGVDLGERAGKSFEATKYDFPHIRDFLLDRGATSDVSETSTVWSNILPLYRAAKTGIQTAIETTVARGFAGCHISHTYRSGASLYFTFGFRQQPDREIEQYLEVKRAVQQSFMDHGGTLSHHHAVGTEHLPWLAADISPLGLAAVGALKHGLDPANVMNPGRLRPGASPFDDWSRIGANAVARMASGR